MSGDTYQFEIINAKYGLFVVTAPAALREKIDAIGWSVRRSPHRPPGRDFVVVGNSPRAGGKQRRIYLHRFIWELLGKPPSETVDHRDHDQLNNAPSNLRGATVQQNTWNSPRRRNNTSGYIGVSYHRSSGRWAASIRCGRPIGLGTFPTAEEAARARDQKARELHGDFAVLNFPEEVTT